MDDLPFTISDGYESIGEVKQLPDGEMVTASEWDQHPESVCGFCTAEIPFSECDQIEKVGGIVACPSCFISLMEMGD